MKKLLLATRNAHKTEEFSALFQPEFEVRDLNAFADFEAIAETGNSFAENAAIKALAVSRAFPDQFVLADDSGLEVEALGGAPGIFSARYAGENAPDAENIAKLLRELSQTNESRPYAARFVCALALAHDGKVLVTSEGTVAGEITTNRSGDSGFGYDPIFVPQGFAETFAELPLAQKNQISHRARAVQNLREQLRRINFAAIAPRAS